MAGAERRVDALRRRGGAAAAAASDSARPRGPSGAFAAALGGASVGVIAEVKRRSPSKGVIDDGLDAVPRAADYVRGGAAAVSVLTEPERFGGSLADLAAVSRTVPVPVLRKDLIVDSLQLHEALLCGASAVLLIARALAPAHAADLAAEAAAHGLDVLFEVRDEDELARAIALPGCVIGVNTRNLETLAIDPEVGARLLPLVPRDRIAVYESGVAGRGDVERAAAAGADAILVGSALSANRDGAAAVATLAGLPRRPRA